MTNKNIYLFIFFFCATLWTYFELNLDFVTRTMLEIRVWCFCYLQFAQCLKHAFLFSKQNESKTIKV